MQATRIALDDVSAGNPAMLLSGDRDVGEDFDFEPSYQLGDIDFIALIPKDPQADFSRILVGFRDGIPARLEIVDGLNQTTRIDFADPEVNKQLDMTQFEFDPPPKTSVLGGRR
jgi:outer membrane lipoprotein carrier protein